MTPDVGADRAAIDALTRTFFAAFTNRGGVVPRLDTLASLFVADARIIRTVDGTPEVMDVVAFAEPRLAWLTDGTLTDFEEAETWSRTDVFGHIAQRYCGYRKAGVRNGQPFQGKGVKSLQFVRTPDGWRLASVIWDDEREGLVAPDAPPAR